MLGGIGAAFGGTAQQFSQGVREREQGITEQKRQELQARQVAMYQDAGAAFKMLQQGNLDGIVSLANDRLQMLNTFPDADPSDTIRILENARAAQAGDPIALRDLATELTSASSAGMAMGILQAPEVDTRVLKPGEQVFRDGEFAYGVDPEPTESFRPLTQQEVIRMGGDPSRMYEINQLTKSVRQIGGGGVTTNIEFPTPVDAATQAMGQGMGVRVNTRIDEATSALQQNANLLSMAQAIADGARTGLGQETLLNLKNLGQSIFGIDIGEGAGQQEVVQAITNQLALQIRNPASGMGLPGATSDRDINFLLRAVPGLSRTPEGNALLIEILIRQNQFKIDIVNEQQRLISENNGAVPADLDTKLIRFGQQYNLVDQKLREDIEQAISGIQGQGGEPSIIDLINMYPGAQ